MIKEIESRLALMDQELEGLQSKEDGPSRLRRAQLARDRAELLELCRDCAPEDNVYLARHPGRPGTADFISALFTEFFECRGDRLHREDPGILGGIALFHGLPVTVIGHRKGKTLEENVACNFGMPSPEGYRKAQRLMGQAERFGRPVITFIDTPGAYPGLEAEAEGQGEAIASTLARMSALTVPVIAVVTGEGGSGGALALGVANRVLMLEHAVYSVLSPEGFASILWKDAGRAGEAAALMKLTAADLLALGVADEVLPEPLGGAHQDPAAVFDTVDQALLRHLAPLLKLRDPAGQRYQKFRAMGLGAIPAARKEKP
ncbi:acetyl-CoA carboxylase carboxyltransferase subunit alpha [Pseudoflavonifractor sp. 524-17]|uniref:acetyl-CoA carboxylase carboxyltransferase subunit alpha n=1 Tax=Pseudoflavonifractor sp. 524-17 TaxID=2304577 RepID=UPI001379D829|nr:acetyl-CoA carboxylase carboxyltransferase subunit alpha [Pseudoflavonifractor sp. 524-17]